MTDLTESSRRPRWILGVLAVVLIAALGGGAYYYKNQSAAVGQADAGGLMSPGPLSDHVLGNAGAPVTIVEYASLTCGHCAQFHNTVLPDLKKQYIDTGKAKLILREFPLDDLAAAAFMVARCAGNDRFYPMVSALFETQQTWAFAEGDPTPKLMQIAKQAGFSEDQFNKCLANDQMLKGIKDTRERAFEKFDVKATPTFFVNGKKMEGAHEIADFQAAIDPLLKTAGS